MIPFSFKTARIWEAAVALGMVCAFAFSARRGLMAAAEAELAELERSGQLVRLVRSERQACWTTPGIAAAEAALLRAARLQAEAEALGSDVAADLDDHSSTVQQSPGVTA